jgi:hypothetical protein
MIDTALEELKQALGATKVQLVPHKLQRTESNQQLVEPTPPSNGQSTSESNKN